MDFSHTSKSGGKYTCTVGRYIQTYGLENDMIHGYALLFVRTCKYRQTVYVFPSPNFISTELICTVHKSVIYGAPFKVMYRKTSQNIYDEMLAFRHFQERGSPINLAPYTPGITLLWSGLRLDNEAIIRAISLKERADILDVEPWPGAHVSLSASTEGTTWRLRYDPDTEQVIKLAID